MSRRDRLRRTALAVGVGAVLLGTVSLVLICWVISQTDTGLMCSEPWSPEEQPGACAVYDLPFWTMGLAVLGVVAALAAGLASLAPAPGGRR